MKHTPGPWHYSEYVDKRESGYIRCNVKLPGANKHVAVARVTGQGREMHANARLIAAAPEMYAELRGVTDWFSEWGVEIGPAEQALLDRIAAIIVKVEGQ